MSAFTSGSYAAFKSSLETPIEEAPPQSTLAPLPHTSRGMFLPWAMCLFIGYLACNIFLINDIYCGGLEINDRLVPSPISQWQLSRLQLGVIYVIASSLTVAGAVVVSRRQMPPAYAIFCLCPVVMIPYLLGMALRKSGAVSRYIACAYLLAGTVLTGLSVMYFATTVVPLPAFHEAPMLHSLKLHSGLALAICGILTLNQVGEKAKDTLV